MPRFPSHIFTPLTRGERSAFVAHYREFLLQRDGAPDFTTYTLSLREPALRAIEQSPVVRAGGRSVDRAVFDRNANEQDVADGGLDEPTLWAVLAARLNRHEQYAVRYLEERGRYVGGSVEDPRTYIDMEERYHGRIIDEALRTLGLEPRWRPPSRLTRFMLRQIVRLPRFISDMTVLCGEIIGVATFMLLRERAAALFADEPAPALRLRDLLTQILVDEVGHVYYLRSQLGPVRLAIARRLLPVIARVMTRDLPEAMRLFGREELLARMLDPEVTSAAAATCEGALSLEYEPAPPSAAAGGYHDRESEPLGGAADALARTSPH